MNDAWYFNGTQWNPATSNAAFTPRSDMAGLVVNNAMYLIGGVDDNYYLNEVWTSTDGANWTQLPQNTPFPGREDTACYNFQNKFWIVGGNNGSPLNDVWMSSDGSNWTPVSSANSVTIFEPRYNHSGLVFNNEMWVIGGEDDDNYYGDGWASPPSPLPIGVTSMFVSYGTVLGSGVVSGAMAQMRTASDIAHQFLYLTVPSARGVYRFNVASAPSSYSYAPNNIPLAFSGTFGDLAVSPSGDVYVVDTGNKWIVKLPYNTTGTYSTYGPAIATGVTLIAPQGIAIVPSGFSKAGYCYVSDPGAQKVLVFDNNMTYQTSLPLNLTHLATDGNYLYGDTLFPSNIANLRRIGKYDLSGNWIAYWGEGGPGDYCASVDGLAVGPCGWIYVSDNQTPGGDHQDLYTAVFDSMGLRRGQDLFVGGSIAAGPSVSGAGSLYLTQFDAQNNLTIYQKTLTFSCPTTIENFSFRGLIHPGSSPTPTPTITPTPTVTPSPTPDPNNFVLAAPNVSHGGEPIDFMVTLPKAMTMDLTLVDLSGEVIYHDTLPGAAGTNTMAWNLVNQWNSRVASGLYIFKLTAHDDATVWQKVGKVAVLH